MTFLEKLEYLMKINGLNKSKLSKACDIPYTTIDGWYKKGYEGLKLTTLRKLASYFNTSLDYWSDNNSKAINTSITESNYILINAYNKAPEDIKKAVNKLLDLK